MRAGLYIGRRDRGRLDVGRVVAVGALDEGVLAGGRGCQELLRRRAAHRPGHGEHDSVVEAQPGEDPLVGAAVRLVGLGKAVVGEVETVGVLHDELTPA